VTWIERKHEIDTSGGRIRIQSAPAGRKQFFLRLREAARELKVDYRTMMKLLSDDPDDKNLLRFNSDWFRLPNGFILIRRKAIDRIIKNKI
jgi:hypothetical protein